MANIWHTNKWSRYDIRTNDIDISYEQIIMIYYTNKWPRYAIRRNDQDMTFKQIAKIWYTNKWPYFIRSNDQDMPYEQMAKIWYINKWTRYVIWINSQNTNYKIQTNEQDDQKIEKKKKWAQIFWRKLNLFLNFCLDFWLIDQLISTECLLVWCYYMPRS